MAKKIRPQATSRGNDNTAFTAHARRVLGRLTETTQTVIRELPNSPRTAADLMRLLGVSRKVAWQAFRVAEAEDPLAAVNFVPGQKPTRDLIAAAVGLGVTRETAKALEQAFDDFERLVRDTAGDRNAFVSMLGNSARDPNANSDADRLHRLNAFKSYSHFCGMQAQLSCDIMMLSEVEPGKRTTVQVRTVAGLCRFREDAQFVVERRRYYSEGAPYTHLDSRPLDPAAAEKYHAPVLPTFCSRPMPEFRIRRESSGTENVESIEWASGQVGIKHFVDVTTGVVTDVTYDVPTDDKPHGIRLTTGISYPVHRLTRHIMIHRPGCDLSPPVLTAYLDPMASKSPEARALSQKLHLGEKIQAYAAGSWTIRPEAFADVREPVAYAAARMGWDPADFAIFRVSIDYPLVNSVVSIELPWTPTAARPSEPPTE